MDPHYFIETRHNILDDGYSIFIISDRIRKSIQYTYFDFLSNFLTLDNLFAYKDKFLLKKYMANSGI